MFDKIFEVLAQIWGLLLPWYVVMPYARGVVCRLGKFQRELAPGFHWVIPLGFDVVTTENVVPRTSRLSGLSTTTSDGRSIGLDAVVTWKIADIKKSLLEVNDLDDAINDTCAGVIGTELSNNEWSAIWHGQAVENLTTVCRKRGWKWGVEIISVQLVGVALVKNLRISSTDGAKHTHFHGLLS